MAKKYSWRHIRSYQERQRIRQRIQRVTLFVISLYLFYQIVTVFFVKPYEVSNVTMQPTLPRRARVLVSPLMYAPTMWFHHRLGSPSLPQRGEIVLVQTKGQEEHSSWYSLFDPVIRFLSFQRAGLATQKTRQHMPRYLIKRVIGLPGDTLKMEKDIIYVRPRGQEYFINEFESSNYIYETIKSAPDQLISGSVPFAQNFSELTLEEDQIFIAGDYRPFWNDSRSFGTMDRSSVHGKIVFVYWPLNRIGWIDKK
jgi:signal peptidase I